MNERRFTSTPALVVRAKPVPKLRRVRMARLCGIAHETGLFLSNHIHARLKWIERLPLMQVDKHRIFVHAGVSPNYSLDEQDPQDAIWKIYDDRDEGGHGQRRRRG